jgi:alpha-galactosidase
MRHLFDRHVLSFLIVVFGVSVIPLQAEEIRLSALDLSKMTQGYGKPGQDKSVAGLPLKIAGRELKHGVGTPAPSLFYVNLGGAAQRFHAFVGVNDGGAMSRAVSSSSCAATGRNSSAAR